MYVYALDVLIFYDCQDGFCMIIEDVMGPASTQYMSNNEQMQEAIAALEQNSIAKIGF